MHKRIYLPTSNTLSKKSLTLLKREILRINMRFIEEFIEGHNICPFSRCGRCVGAVGRRIYTEEITSETPVLTESFLKTLDKVAQNPKIEVMLCIFPWARLPAQSWQYFTEHVRNAVNKRQNKIVYAAAAFHPELDYNDDTPDRAVTFFRKAPDPSVQLVRLDTLDSAGAGTPDTTVANLELITAILAGNMPPKTPKTITEIVTNDNFAMLHKHGIQKLKTQLQDIYKDREESIQAILNNEIPERTKQNTFCSIPLTNEVRKKIEAQGLACRRDSLSS